MHLLEWLASGEIASLNRASRQERNSHRTCLKTETDGEVRVLLDHERMWNTRFGGTAIIVAESRGDVSDPRCDDFCNASSADQLVELHVRDRCNQRQILSVLTDHFMARSKRYERFQCAAHRDRHAVLHVARNGFMQRADFIHGSFFYPLGNFNSMLGK